MQGLTGKLGLALMTDLKNVPTAPTVALRPKNFLNPLPEVTTTDEDVATGTRFGRQRFIQGFEAGNRQLTASAALRDLPILIEALLGPADAAGVVNVRAQKYGALMPNQPLAVFQETELSNVLFPAAQISSLSITVSQRQNAEVQVTLNTGATKKLTESVTFPAQAATEIAQFLHFYLKVAGVKYAPESITIKIEQQLAAEDGARGLDVPDNMFIIGWSVDGPLTASIEFTLNEAGASVGGGNLKALVNSSLPDDTTGAKTPMIVEAGIKIGDKQVKFELPMAELTASNIPTDLGRWTVGFTANGTGLGVSPINVTLPPTPTPAGP